MDGDNEMSKYVTNENKAGFEEPKQAPEETYMINEPVSFRINETSEDEEYRILDDPEDHTLNGIFDRVGREYGI